MGAKCGFRGSRGRTIGGGREIPHACRPQGVGGYKTICFFVSLRKTMQNHAEIRSTNHFGARNVRNLMKSRKLVMTKATVD